MIKAEMDGSVLSPGDLPLFRLRPEFPRRVILAPHRRDHVKEGDARFREVEQPFTSVLRLVDAEV